MILRTDSSLLYPEKVKQEFNELNKCSVNLWEEKSKGKKKKKPVKKKKQKNPSPWGPNAKRL